MVSDRNTAISHIGLGWIHQSRVSSKIGTAKNGASKKRHSPHWLASNFSLPLLGRYRYCWNIMRRLFVLFGILLMHEGFMRGQIDTLEEAAKAAQSGDATAVRALIDTVMNHLPLRFHPSLNLDDRLFEAELQYRHQNRAS